VDCLGFFSLRLLRRALALHLWIGIFILDDGALLDILIYDAPLTAFIISMGDADPLATWARPVCHRRHRQP
jgi:hypothetical protein